MNKECGDKDAIWKYEMPISQDIITEIKIRRLKLLGYDIVMENTSKPKMIIKTKPEGRHQIGRPKLSWSDDAEIHKETLGKKRFRLKAQNRQKRTVILKDAKVKVKLSL
jgi:hypothetical protein